MLFVKKWSLIKHKKRTPGPQVVVLPPPRIPQVDFQGRLEPAQSRSLRQVEPVGDPNDQIISNLTTLEPVENR